MEDQWYYTGQKQRMGPVSEGQLRQLASTGQLKPTDLVWKQGMASWRPASEVAGLFPPSISDEPPPLPLDGLPPTLAESEQLTQPGSPLPRSEPVAPESSARKLRCLKCGADNVQSLRVLYELGSSTTNATTLGVATTGRGLGVGVAETAGKQQTLLAQRCAPPKKPELKNKGGCMAAAIGLGASLLFSAVFVAPFQDKNGQSASNVGGFLFIVVWIAVGVFYYKYYNTNKLPLLQDAYNKEMVAYNDALARWERSYYCSRCGHFFEWIGGVEPSRDFEWPKG